MPPKGKGFKPHHLLLCDDIRYELRNKLTLVGSYAPSVNVRELPAALRLAFRVELQFHEKGPTPLEIEVVDPARKAVVGLQAQIDVDTTEEMTIIPCRCKC